MPLAANVAIGVAVVLAILLAAGLRVINQYERGIVFVFGRVHPKPREAGLAFVMPLIARLERISLRLEAMDVPKQDIITRDNVPVRVNAVVFFSVTDPLRSVLEVKNYTVVTSQKAQTTLRSVLGAVELDELLTDRDNLNKRLEGLIGQEAQAFGITVRSVEIKDVELPEGMQRAMARQAEAERERRAKVIAAEGEYQAAEQLAKAAEIIDSKQSALQLRYLQTMAEVAAEANTTTFFPIPMDLIKAFMPRHSG